METTPRWWKVGDTVWVYSLGCWYPGTVARVTPRRLYVDYSTGRKARTARPYSITDARIVYRGLATTPPEQTPHGDPVSRHAPNLLA